jgi:hypothetical protein
MTIAILSKEFQTEVEAKLKITDVNKALYDNLSQQHFYFQLLIECKTGLREVIENLDAIYQELLHYYKFEYSFQLKTKDDLEAYIKNNKKYKDVNKIYQLKKLEQEVLEETIKMFQSRSFTLNNILKFQELEKR